MEKCCHFTYFTSSVAEMRMRWFAMFFHSSPKLPWQPSDILNLHQMSKYQKQSSSNLKSTQSFHASKVKYNKIKSTVISQKAWQLNTGSELSKFANTQKNNSHRIANTQKIIYLHYILFILFIWKFQHTKNQILNKFSYLILN